MTDAERDRIINTVVHICAAGHSPVLYYERRGEPQPCPVCLAKQAKQALEGGKA